MHDDARPRIGLALSGGTAKSIAHIGVLRALEEADLRPDVIVGTSGGSLISVVYASGAGLDRMVEMAEAINWRRLARVRIPRLGLFSNQGVAELVRDTVGDLTFEELAIPTHVVTTDLLTGEKVVFCKGPVAPAVQASCSIPQIFTPVPIGDGLYADGGFVEYLPVQTLRTLSPEIVIGVHLGAYSDFRKPPRHMLSMIMRTMGIVTMRNARISSGHADVLIAPRLAGFASFDLKRADELLERGHEAAVDALPAIRHVLDLAATPSTNGWRKRFRSLWRGSTHDVA